MIKKPTKVMFKDPELEETYNKLKMEMNKKRDCINGYQGQLKI